MATSPPVQAVEPFALEPNGLPVYPLEVEGTGALTILLAFDAGARSELPEENGIAHFLEHLVFKGGKRYPTYREINRTAEGLGGVLNAYTSQELVAFHITVRANSAPQALDLLTDFVGRPQLDPGELERERGVVVQEINRAYDQPAVVAEYLIDRAAFGDHPLGRTILGPAEHIERFTREQVVAFRNRRWSGRCGGAFLVGNLRELTDRGALEELLARLPDLPPPPPYPPAPPPRSERLVEQRDTNQSHLRLLYRPSVDPTDPAARAALAVYSTLLGGSMASRLFEELRERRGLCYSVYASGHALADTCAVQIGAGLESKRTLEAYALIREIVETLAREGPTAEEVERARAYTAGRLVLAFENSGALARTAAESVIVRREPPDPAGLISQVDRVELAEVATVAAAMAIEPAVACVGPHSAEEF